MKRTICQGELDQSFSPKLKVALIENELTHGFDFTGKIAVITDGDTGIGLEATKALVMAGATVVVTTNDIKSARKKLSGIDNVELEKINIESAESINAFAEKFLISNRPLHLLVNNASAIWVPKCTRECVNQKRYVGQIHLTTKLWPALTNANSARVINISPFGHQVPPIDFVDVTLEYDVTLRFKPGN